MYTKSIQTALKIFEAHQGVLNTAQALRLGIQPRTLYQMRDKGLLVKVSRGIYRLAENPAWSNPDLALVALRIPRGVICLVSALHFHGLTTQVPHQVDVALLQHSEKPRLDYPPVRFVWLSAEAFSAGVEEHVVDNITLRVYSPAKTIADCFKFRNKIGLDVALEALREGLRHKRCTVDELLHFAGTNRVQNIIHPYLEALV